MAHRTRPVLLWVHSHSWPAVHREDTVLTQLLPLCLLQSPFSQAFNMPNMNFGFGIAMPRIELPFSNPCQQTSQIQAPDAVPQWTCGLEAKGKFDCTGESVLAIAGYRAG